MTSLGSFDVETELAQERRVLTAAIHMLMKPENLTDAVVDHFTASEPLDIGRDWIISSILGSAMFLLSKSKADSIIW